jgi:hypothetical protein
MKKFEKFVNELRELRMNKPFQPFNVILKNGKSYTVGRRLWFACNDLSMVVLPKGIHVQFLGFDEVDSLKPIKKHN